MASGDYKSRSIDNDTIDAIAELAEELTNEGRKATGDENYKVTDPTVIRRAVLFYKKHRKEITAKGAL